MKNVILLIVSLLGVLFFGYTWLSSSYNDSLDYNCYENSFGQFVFFGFLAFFIYGVLKVLEKETLFSIIIIIAFVAILILYLTKHLFLWPLAIVLLIAMLFFKLRNYL